MTAHTTSAKPLCAHEHSSCCTHLKEEGFKKFMEKWRLSDEDMVNIDFTGEALRKAFNEGILLGLESNLDKQTLYYFGRELKKGALLMPTIRKYMEKIGKKEK